MRPRLATWNPLSAAHELPRRYAAPWLAGGAGAGRRDRRRTLWAVVPDMLDGGAAPWWLRSVGQSELSDVLVGVPGFGAQARFYLPGT